MTARCPPTPYDAHSDLKPTRTAYLSLNSDPWGGVSRQKKSVPVSEQRTCVCPNQQVFMDRAKQLRKYRDKQLWGPHISLGREMWEWNQLSRPNPSGLPPPLLTPRFLIDNVSSVKLLTFLVCLTLSASGLQGSLAQSTQAPEWPTGSFDQQRDAWQRNETKFTVDNVKNTRLLWKLKTDNQPMGMQSFREPIIVAGVNTASGAKTLAIVAGSSDDVYVVDVASGTLVWQKHL